MAKILNLKSFLRELVGLKKRGRRIVFTNGCFDILHLGHIYLLKRAKSLGDILVVGLNSDRSVRMLKGKSRPIKDENTRAKILSELRPVDYILIFPEPTPLNLIKKIKPHILVKGGDWKLKEIVGADILRSYGGKVIRLPYLRGHSTTHLIKKLKMKI